MQTSISQFARDSASQLYLGFFGRNPDTAGFHYWSAQINSGRSPIDVAMGFASSDEFMQTYGSLSAKEKIDLVYQNILERDPDPGGSNYWTGLLESGMPIGEIVWRLINSAFNQQGTADGILIQTKIADAHAIMAPVILDQPISEWSIKTGYGHIDLTAALSATLGISIQEGAHFETSIEQWAIPVVGFHNAWTEGFTGKNVVIAAIDSGIDLSNAALTQNISPYSWNFVSNNDNIQDDHGHGTAIASEMIARPPGYEGEVGITGGAYDAELMVLKVVDASGNGSQANLIAAINHAVFYGADVINISLGGGNFDNRMLEALNYAAEQGVIVALAAGNFGASSPQFPAWYAQLNSNTIAVGASFFDEDGNLTALENTNHAGSSTPYNYVLAPGAQILAYGLNGEIQSWSGSSFAAPMVSAAIAIMLSANTSLNATQIVDALVNTSINLVGTPSLPDEADLFAELA